MEEKIWNYRSWIKTVSFLIIFVRDPVTQICQKEERFDGNVTLVVIFGGSDCAETHENTKHKTLKLCKPGLYCKQGSKFTQYMLFSVIFFTTFRLSACLKKHVRIRKQHVIQKRWNIPKVLKYREKKSYARLRWKSWCINKSDKEN